MKEEKVENYLRTRVLDAGGFCVKMSPLGLVGIPDRLVVLPGVIAFVELKRPKGARVSAMQKYWHTRLRAMDHKVGVLYTTYEVDQFIDEVT